MRGLKPISAAYNLGFSRHELRRIERLVKDNVDQRMRK
jgi:hypothetical protein